MIHMFVVGSSLMRTTPVKAKDVKTGELAEHCIETYWIPPIVAINLTNQTV
jgi:hypothetical protein